MSIYMDSSGGPMYVTIHYYEKANLGQRSDWEAVREAIKKARITLEQSELPDDGKESFRKRLSDIETAGKQNPPDEGKLQRATKDIAEGVKNFASLGKAAITFAQCVQGLLFVLGFGPPPIQM